MPIVLRCPGPLLTLRCLAGLHGVRTQTLVERLPECEADLTVDAPAEALADAVADALGTPARPPLAVHYFHRAWLLDPPVVLEEGLGPLPNALDAAWTRLGALLDGDVDPGDWARLRPAVEADATYRRRLRDARRRGPRGALVRDVALRPDVYGAPVGPGPSPAVQAIAAACEARLGVDLAVRYERAATPCLIEYRRRPERPDAAVAAALWYACTALRGEASPRAISPDGHGASVPPGDVISVRTLDTEVEWVGTGW